MRMRSGFLGQACLVAALLHAPICAAQTIFAFAGTGTGGYNGEAFSPVGTQFNFPNAAAFDAGGNFYIVDTNNHRLRRVTFVGAVSTHFGTGAAGTGINQLNLPLGVAVHRPTGDIYIADSANHRVLRLPSGS